MKIINGNLIDVIKNGECNVALHVANCKHTMGGGVARALREEFPIVYETDLKTQKNDYNKLGTNSYAQLNIHPKMDLSVVVNMYAQYNFGGDQRNLDYTAFEMCIKKVANQFSDQIIAYPFLMGCDRAGGDWEIVSKIIHAHFHDINHFAVKLPI